MVCIDAEWGLGMRLDSVIPLNHQMMLGAVRIPLLFMHMESWLVHNVSGKAYR